MRDLSFCILMLYVEFRIVCVDLGFRIKQTVVSRSNDKIEFRDLVHGICGGMWLQKLLSEFRSTILVMHLILPSNRRYFNKSII